MTIFVWLGQGWATLADIAVLSKDFGEYFFAPIFLTIALQNFTEVFLIVFPFMQTKI